MANHTLHHVIGQNPTKDGQTAARHVTDSGQRVFKTSQQTVSGRQQLHTINQSINIVRYRSIGSIDRINE